MQKIKEGLTTLCDLLFGRSGRVDLEPEGLSCHLGDTPLAPVKEYIEGVSHRGLVHDSVGLFFVRRRLSKRVDELVQFVFRNSYHGVFLSCYMLCSSFAIYSISRSRRFVNKIIVNKL